MQVGRESIIINVFITRIITIIIMVVVVIYLFIYLLTYLYERCVDPDYCGSTSNVLKLALENAFFWIIFSF